MVRWLTSPSRDTESLVCLEVIVNDVVLKAMKSLRMWSWPVSACTNTFTSPHLVLEFSMYTESIPSVSDSRPVGPKVSSL